MLFICGSLYDDLFYFGYFDDIILCLESLSILFNFPSFYLYQATKPNYQRIPKNNTPNQTSNTTPKIPSSRSLILEKRKMNKNKKRQKSQCDQNIKNSISLGSLLHIPITNQLIE